MASRHSRRLCAIGLLLACSLLWVSCSSSSHRNAPITMQGRLVIQEYSDVKPGSLDREIELTQDSDFQKHFNAWLSKPHEKQHSFETYAPKLIVETDKTMVNFVGDTVVLASRENQDDVWTQYTWPADEEAIRLKGELLELFENQIDRAAPNN
ncbi:hypothetical protein Pan258_26420 [Symmachiella dynata]|nr:hypothetical protein Pan258_26420 [Symmachiella dynata]